MNTKRIALLAATLFAASATLHAGSRTSSSYNVATDITDAGGKRATSASYTNDGSLGGLAGISTVAAPAETAKAGYIAQLYETTGLALTAAAPTVNETATDQLAAWLSLDDATFLTAPATSVTWSVQSGPLTSISANGLATAGIVYQNTAATAQGVHLGFTATLGLTVLNTLPDNFGSYAGDGLGDDWQVQHFGLNNANAAPALDPDGDGQTNAFEFTAGLVPTNSSSRFTLSIQSVPGQPLQKRLVFSPRLSDRLYTVTAKSSLTAGSYTPLSNPSAPSDNGQERTITDLNASGLAKFYRVEIAKP